MRVETIYICDYCESKHKTWKEVIECETLCKSKIKEFEVIKFEFYHELGKIKKFDSLEDRLNFLKDKFNILNYKLITTRGLTKEISCSRRTMFRVCGSLAYKINRLKATIKDRRCNNAMVNTQSS